MQNEAMNEIVQTPAPVPLKAPRRKEAFAPRVGKIESVGDLDSVLFALYERGL